MPQPLDRTPDSQLMDDMIPQEDFRAGGKSQDFL